MQNLQVPLWSDFMMAQGQLMWSMFFTYIIIFNPINRKNLIDVTTTHFVVEETEAQEEFEPRYVLSSRFWAFPTVPRCLSSTHLCLTSFLLFLFSS